MAKSILAVDDEHYILDLFRVCFRDSGYELITDFDPVNAFHVAVQRARSGNSIDLLITDLQMPSLGGLDLIRNVRVVSPNTKFMLQSGREEAEVMRLIAALRNEGIEVTYIPPRYLFDTGKFIGAVKSTLGE